MSNQTGRSIRAQLMWLSLIIVTVSVALSLAGTLYITLRTERKTLDQNLLNSASILSQVPLVREALLGEVPADELADFLDAATARTSDIDLILVGDTESVLRYAPDRSFIGSRYTGSAQTRALAGAEPYTFDDSGPTGSDHSAYAPIRDESGAVIGFMAVGLYLRSLTHVALTTALRLAAIGALAAGSGGPAGPAAVPAHQALPDGLRTRRLRPALPPAGGHSGGPGRGDSGHRPGRAYHLSQRRRSPDALPGAGGRHGAAPSTPSTPLPPLDRILRTGRAGVQREHEVPQGRAGAG